MYRLEVGISLAIAAVSEGLIAVTTTTLAQAQVFHAFNARSREHSAFTARLFTNG